MVLDSHRTAICLRVCQEWGVRLPRAYYLPIELLLVR